MTWLASFPKSGNTWVRILHTLARNPELTPKQILPNLIHYPPWEADRKWFEPLLGKPWLAAGFDDYLKVRHQAQKKLAQAFDENVLIKTHNVFTSLKNVPLFAETPSGSSPAKAIHLVRNPLDIAVSLKHHAGLDEDTAVRGVTNPDLIVRRHHTATWEHYGSWLTHTRSWLDNKAYEIYFLHYEDLVNGNVRALQEALLFSGVTLTENEVSLLFEKTNIKELQRAEKLVGFDEIETDRGFFRQGKANAWKKELSVSAVKKLVSHCGEMMQRLGYSDA